MRHRRTHAHLLERGFERRGGLGIHRCRAPGARVVGENLHGLQLERFDHLHRLIEATPGAHVHADSPFLGHRIHCMKGL